MSTNISLSKRPNPQKPKEPWKYYALAQYSGTMDIDTFAEHISSHNSKYRRADIAAVLTMAVDCMRENLLAGYLIRLGDLGTFETAIHCSGVENAADFKADVNILDMYVNWTPGTRFTNMLSEATFNLVPSRKSMRKIMKAIKAGELSVDLSDEKDSSSDSINSATDGDDSSSTDNGSDISGSGSDSSDSDSYNESVDDGNGDLG